MPSDARHLSPAPALRLRGSTICKPTLWTPRTAGETTPLGGLGDGSRVTRGVSEACLTGRRLDILHPTSCWLSVGLMRAARDRSGRFGARYLAAAAVALGACSGDSLRPVPSSPVASVEVQPQSVTLGFGEAMTVTAVARDAAGTVVAGRPATWSSSDPSRVTVTTSAPTSGTAVATAVGFGEVTITATVDGKTGSAKLTAAAPMVVWPDTSRILVSMNRVLRAQRVGGLHLSGPRFLTTGVTWESSDPTVATVDAQGRVTAVAEGHTTISAVLPGRRLKGEVFVSRYPSPLTFTSVAVGDWHACGVTSEAALYCWGHNDRGQLGTDAILDRCERFLSGGGGILERRNFRCSEAPVPVNTTLRFSSVSVGGQTTCAVTPAGTAYCWGDNRAGQTGTGLADTSVFAPTPVRGGITFRSVDVGFSQACGVSTTDAAYCWGRNSYGELGNGTEAASVSPTLVAGGHAWRIVRAGSTACGIRTDNAAYCWGRNDVGQAGFPVSVKSCTSAAASSCSTTPLAVAGDPRFTQLAVRGASCGLVADGSAYCWGALDAGASAHVPKLVPGGLHFTTLHSGPCGVDANGAAYCWSVSGSSLTTPTRALPDFPVRAYEVVPQRYYLGPSHRCALDAAAILYCWDGVSNHPDSPLTFFWAPEFSGPLLAQPTPVRVAGQQ